VAVGVSSSGAAQPERVRPRAATPATREIPRNFFMFLLVVGVARGTIGPALDRITLKAGWSLLII
jgi:hypothetical protein